MKLQEIPPGYISQKEIQAAQRYYRTGRNVIVHTYKAQGIDSMGHTGEAHRGKNEEAARKLARYRVGEDQHMGKSMTADEIELRRGYVRNMLRNVPGWKDLTDEQLDRVRIYRTGEDWYVEDADFYEYRF